MLPRHNNNREFLLALLAATTITLSSRHLALASPPRPTANFVDDIVKEQPGNKEVDDMQITYVPIDAAPGYSSREFVHHDEDQLLLTKNDFNIPDTLKYDVEMLEPLDTKKDATELEERYRGAAALQVNNDAFVGETIEVGDKDVTVVMMQQSHFLLTIILIGLGLASISAYTALVVWRSRLEQRYGMRQLLVMNDEDAAYESAAHIDRNSRQLSAAGQV